MISSVTIQPPSVPNWGQNDHFSAWPPVRSNTCTDKKPGALFSDGTGVVLKLWRDIALALKCRFPYFRYHPGSLPDDAMTKTLLLVNQSFCLFMGECFTDFVFIHCFFCRNKSIHTSTWQSRANALLIQSMHATTFTQSRDFGN